MVLEPQDVEHQVRELLALPRAARREAILQMARREHAEPLAVLGAVVRSEVDRTSRETAIKALGRLADPAAVAVLLPHFEAHRAVVVKALIGLGVFAHVMPTTTRERRLFCRALQCASPGLRTLIAGQRVTPETLRDVLPPMM